MERFNDLSVWDTPPYAAHVVPVTWEPNHATGERFVAVVAIRYETPAGTPPSSHIVFRHQQLRAMIGHRRASSAYGILEHVSRFIFQQLVADVPLSELSTPFEGFTTGRPVRARGYSENQVVDTAIRTLSAFGTRDTYVDEQEGVQRNSVPTSQFLRTLRTTFAGDEKDLRARFNRRIQWPGTPEITIDYAHNKYMVQVTSLPQSVPHLITLQKEAESKMFELDVATTLMRRDAAVTFPALLVNTAALSESVTDDAEVVARSLLDRLRFMSEQKEMSIIETTSPADAARILGELDFRPTSSTGRFPRMAVGS